MPNNLTQKRNITKYPRIRPLWLGVFADIMGFTFLAPIMPQLADKFNVGIPIIGLVMSTNALFGLICGPILGKLSDKYGRKPLLLISQIGTFLGFLVLAFSNNLTMLFISRIVDGLFGGNFPIAKAIIGDIVHPKDRSDQMSNIGVAHNLANLIAPGVSGILFSFLGLVGPGLVAATLSLVTIFSNIFLLEETAPTKVKDQVPSIPKENKHAPEKSSAIGPSDGEKTEYYERNIWKNRTALVLLVQWFFHTLAFMTYVTSFSFFATRMLGLGEHDTWQLGVLLSISGAFQIIVKFFIFLPIMRRTGERLLSRIGLGIFVALFLLAGFTTSWIQLILVMLGISFAASSTRGILTSFLTRSVDKRDMGKVMGYSTSLDNISQVMGPIIGTNFINSISLNLFGVIPSILSVGAFGMAFIKLDLKLDEQ